MSKEKILLVNAIPLNNGDAALVFSLYHKLVKKGHQVKIATYYYREVKKQYPDYPFVKELGQHFIFTKLPFLKFILLPFLFLFSKEHRKSAIIIGVPGGYINSNYRIKSSLHVFKIAKLLGKKTAIYAQSVGPLNTKDSLYLKKLLFNSIDYLMLRDSYSYETIKNLNILESKYSLTKDAAFLLESAVNLSQKSKRVAFSVREWNYDNRNRKKYINLIKSLLQLIVDNGYEITLLSTCQGIDSYKNDALLAEEICNTLSEKTQKHILLDKKYYKFDDFYNTFREFDFVVGTRLHMCILALTNYIPAFNISYEIKGKETYSYLGLEKYSIDYNDDIDKSVLHLQDFIKNLPKIAVYLENKIPEIRKEVINDFEKFYKKMSD